MNKGENYMSEWISVEDSFPVNGQSCLIVNSSYTNNIASAYFSHGKFYDSLGYFADDYKPTTHWMPLPEPPKEIEEEER